MKMPTGTPAGLWGHVWGSALRDARFAGPGSPGLPLPPAKQSHTRGEGAAAAVRGGRAGPLLLADRLPAAQGTTAAPGPRPRPPACGLPGEVTRRSGCQELLTGFAGGGAQPVPAWPRLTCGAAWAARAL